MKAIEIAKIELRNFRLTDDQLRYELNKAGINESEDVGDIDLFTTSRPFELMRASMVLNFILTESESWAQGDRSEKRNFNALKNYVSSIYRKYGLMDPFEEKKTATIRRL